MCRLRLVLTSAHPASMTALLGIALSLGCGAGASATADASVADAHEPSLPLAYGELGCEPGWSSLHARPSGADASYARFPACLVHMEWESCGRGCQLLTPDPRFAFWSVSARGWTEGTQHYFAISEYLPPADELASTRLIAAIVTPEGQAHAAFRNGLEFGPRIESRLTGVALGAGQLGLAWNGRVVDAGRTTDNQTSLYWGARAAFASIPPASTPLAPPEIALDDMFISVSVSSTTMAGVIWPRAQVALLQAGEVRLLGGAGSVIGLGASQLVLIGEDVFWLETGEAHRIAHARFDLEPEVFLDTPDTDIIALASDGHDFVWVQGYGPTADGYARRELWTAPYTPDAGSLLPRVLSADYRGSNSGTLNAGLFATLGPDRTALIYALDDGSVRQWDNADRFAVYDEALWVDSEEVAYSAQPAGSSSPTLVRLSLSRAYHSAPGF